MVFFEQNEKNDICNSYQNSEPSADHQYCPRTCRNKNYFALATAKSDSVVSTQESGPQQVAEKL